MFGKRKKEVQNLQDTQDMQDMQDMQSTQDIQGADDAFSDFFEDNMHDMHDIQEGYGYAEDTGMQGAQEGQDEAEVFGYTENQDVKATKKEKKRHIGKGKKAEQNTDKPIEKSKMLLYLIIDREVDGLLDYFRQSGVNVSNIFFNITAAKNEVLMQSEPLRIVIVDTGLGKFTTTTMRAELIDMLGISDEQNRTSVFFTDSVLKIDTIRALGKSGKDIDWRKYESTAMVVATLLSYNEEYITTSDASVETRSNPSDILNFRGIKASIPDVPRMEISGFSKDAIITHVLSNTDDCLPGYTIRL